MEERGEIEMESSMQKFCVSWFAIRVCCVGTKLAVQAWNEHTILGILTDNWSAEGLTHIRIYMGGLILGNTLYMLFCFFNIKLFALV